MYLASVPLNLSANYLSPKSTLQSIYICLKSLHLFQEQQTTGEPAASSLPEEPLYSAMTQGYIKTADDARHVFDENKDQQKNLEKEMS